MDLFNTDLKKKILPYDGDVIYMGPILSREKSITYMNSLLHSIEWKNDEAILFGKHYVTARKVAWYGDHSFSYTYSGTTKHALIWTKELLELKSIIEKNCTTRFNSCLLNLYHNGKEGMAYHSDDEEALGKNTVIACLTLGAQRKFLFKHKSSGAIVSLILENGSLLVMRGETQTYWMHRLPPMAKINTPRISLTFRTIIHPGSGHK
ncbi:MAG TPA: alpha-ketoglutarate-dependent dioxygenase AlkB [Bacteroidia bacterium]|jgi:alkylated DNA repair dioxygenase AlkB|nr:alpha-ketoglutarate-dependent dioxygenase AlkB [Bacteroidia bacterium]